MKTLTMKMIAESDQLISPDQFFDFTENSPALTIFTDCKHYQPLSIRATTPIEEASEIMNKAHVNFLLVTDANNHFQGVIDHKHLDEQSIMQRVAQGIHREDISVQDLMISRMKLIAIDYKDLESASIGDIIRTLENSSRNYCLAIDTSLHHIRGIFSIDDINQRLHTDFSINEQKSLASILYLTKYS